MWVRIPDRRGCNLLPLFLVQRVGSRIEERDRDRQTETGRDRKTETKSLTDSKTEIDRDRDGQKQIDRDRQT